MDESGKLVCTLVLHEYMKGRHLILDPRSQGREIKPNDRISLKTTNGESVLRFEAATGDDCGKYEINVENIFGVDTYTTSLAVEGIGGSIVHDRIISEMNINPSQLLQRLIRRPSGSSQRSAERCGG